MNKQQYDTIKWQINQEKEHILKEVYELTTEKRKIEQKKEYDLYVVQSRSHIVQAERQVMVGMLSSHTFSPERIEEWNRKIQKIAGFIKKNESFLEQIKEKERIIDEMYQEECKKIAKEQEKLEEKTLLDLKMCMNR
ncbi:MULTISPECIES: cytoplasmic protein [Bacillus cereus group]|uniref:cytoplasmic protein n=1 Tax=Bacillus cereus group TaxID=86661 RepID=UPI00086401E5|nr:MULTISPECIES: cytoplasmic protein [Bacillus cereus group]AWC28303.1 cytoplasmic protein [Bacillus cytotoxicus]AWC40312.1 cytoplasmic protein [Bacillus cytotoxicus]AWC48243.1 cytoplasmic protein [Bacillus cytotoxicus]AWC52370.1 cytoplasmic protein [Bacillus cytotoxicus]AWC56504.1 cytoplasmic protein [Bacillus cytotoxicus]